jgi:hypothetical protein
MESRQNGNNKKDPRSHFHNVNIVSAKEILRIHDRAVGEPMQKVGTATRQMVAYAGLYRMGKLSLEGAPEEREEVKEALRPYKDIRIGY